LKLPKPREFDEAAALEATMRCFGAGGFAAISVRDLGDAMGLGQASVYNAFGGKRALFTQCLDRYLDANMKARIARVEQSLPPRLAIETFLAEIGQRDGSISTGVDPADVGRLLLTTVMGLRVLARGFPNRAVLEGTARQALSVLGKPIRRRKPSVRL
jgi:TetR/AcrR family transcriptional repressor of nem operon